MRSTPQMIIACDYGSATHEEINLFVKTYAEVEDVWDHELFEVYNQDVKIARGRLSAYLKGSTPTFTIDSSIGEIACRSELKLQIERLVEGEITQEAFRDFFINLETQIMIKSDFDPKFLGDLYNACDCFDKDWNFTPNDYLLEEAARVLKAIQAAEIDSN